MNYCPDCSERVVYTGTTDDVATTHTRYSCPKCTADWEETVSKDTGKVLHISPVEGGD